MEKVFIVEIICTVINLTNIKLTKLKFKFTKKQSRKADEMVCSSCWMEIITLSRYLYVITSLHLNIKAST